MATDVQAPDAALVERERVMRALRSTRPNCVRSA